jgi:hypothetical protein
VGSYNTAGEALGVAVSGSYAYVADGSGGLQVIDVADPVHLRRVGGHETGGEALAVTVSGSYAYLADGSAGLRVFDISHPASPRRVGGNSAFFAYGVVVDANRVHVAAGWDGLVILDAMRSPLRLSIRPPAPGGQARIAISGPAGLLARLQRSTNLRDWEDGQTFTLVEQPTEIEETAAEAVRERFYRAVGE